MKWLHCVACIMMCAQCSGNPDVPGGLPHEQARRHGHVWRHSMVTIRIQARALARREFLKASGQAGLGALALMVGGGALLPGQQAVAQRASDGIREMRLETREVMWELAPGKRIKAMAYNGQVPGPEIRVQEGERVRVVLTNALAEPTTIHWHGLEVPNP